MQFEEGHLQIIVQQINDMLLAAGYFRSRIPGISQFDKILGGICWSITGSYYNIDIEFEDDLTMGQKIKLSEKVVEALKRMKCPYKLAPFQIQGLDYEKLFPVIQWLVKVLIESRDTRSLVNKRQANFYYKNSFGVLGHPPLNSRETREITNKFKPGRILRRKNLYDLHLRNPKRIYSTLREFNDITAKAFYGKVLEMMEGGNKNTGNKGKGGNLMGSSVKRAQTISTQIKDAGGRAKGKGADLEDEEDFGGLMESGGSGVSGGFMSEETMLKVAHDQLTSGSKDDLGIQLKLSPSEQEELRDFDKEVEHLDLDRKVKSDNISKMFFQNILTHHQTLTEYDQMARTEAQSDILGIFHQEKERFHAQIESLRHQIALKDAEKMGAEQEMGEVQGKVYIVEKEIRELKKLGEDLEETVETIKQSIEQQKIQKTLLLKTEALVGRIEEYKSQKNKLKKDYKAEKDKLESELEKVKDRLDKLGSEESKEILDAIDENYEEEYRKLLAKKEELAQKNKIISMLQRRIEQCPSRTELTQYQHRFYELYDQVNRRNEEAKKYISLFNTLTETKKICEQQLEYLMDAKDGYRKCKKKKEKETFMKTLQEIVTHIRSSVELATRFLQKVKTEKEAAQGSLTQLQSEERNYFKIMGEFQKACAQNQETTIALQQRMQENIDLSNI